MTGHTKRTFGDWYEDNKEGLSERRKLQYKENPDFRKKTLLSNKVYRMKVKGMVLSPKTKEFTVKGITVTGYSLRKIANELEVSCRYISQLIAKGILPNSTLTPSKQRFYTERQCNLMVKFLKDGSKDRTLFNNWEK